jgi:hypothetical protein
MKYFGILAMCVSSIGGQYVAVRREQDRNHRGPVKRSIAAPSRSASPRSTDVMLSMGTHSELFE